MGTLIGDLEARKAGSVMRLYDNFNWFVANNIFLPICKGLGLSEEDMSYTPVQRKRFGMSNANNLTSRFHGLADAGEVVREDYRQGNYLQGVTRANVAVAGEGMKFAGRSVTDMFSGAVGLNNIAMCLAGVILGGTVGNGIGGGFMGMALMAGTGLLGYFGGDHIMKATGYDLEGSVADGDTSPSPVPT